MKIAKKLKRVFSLYILLFPLLVQPTSALEYSTRFSTCAQMKKQYRFGVALSLKVAGDYPAKISKSIYGINSFLDLDSDGIVCENEVLQNNLNPNTKASPTTTSTTTVAPIPQSPQILTFQNGGSATLRKGVTYQIRACGIRPYPVQMEAYSISAGWITKANGIFTIDTILCPNPGAYIVSFGWTVTENPGEITKIRAVGYWNAMEMKIVITN